jgi:SAM-dependent methyltransferase
MDKSKKNRKSGFSIIQVFVLLILVVSMLQRVLQQPDLILDVSSDNYPTTSSSSSTTSEIDNRNINPLSIPQGQAQNLPSVRITDEKLEKKRDIYGGKGDAKHLGGFTEIDMHGISPATWKHAVQNWTVQSVLDVGCGKGTSTSWFATHGLRTECVEGSHDAIEQNMVLDKSILTEHDFSRGPWWPGKTFDMVWSVEFLEHVNLQFQYNYISTFRKAAILLVTSSNWGGWHHVEIHDADWWIRKYESYGFRYDPALTEEIRSVARQEKGNGEIFPPNGKKYNAQHVWSTMKVFINPVRVYEYE